MDALQQATTRDLIEELQVRFPAMIFAGVQDAPGDETAEDALFIAEGSKTTCYGLSHRLLEYVQETLGEFGPAWEDEGEP